MLIPIKKIVLEEGINKFFDNIANGKRNTYSEKDLIKDKNILKFSGIAGGIGGGIIGQGIDSMIDGNTVDNNGNQINEPNANGAAIGALIGAGGTATYGLNNNHKFITGDHISNLKEKAKKLKETPLFKFERNIKNKGK